MRFLILDIQGWDFHIYLLSYPWVSISSYVKEKTSEKESLRYLSVISVLFLEESPVPISIVIYIWGCLENEL